MSKPKTFAAGKLGNLWLELSVLYVLATVATVHLSELHWTIAMLVTPLLMVGMLSVVAILVQTLWMLVVGMEKLASCIGVRKSPLV